jgi:hypothetical protein
MKKTFTRFLLVASTVFISSTLFSQTTENFNSRPGVAVNDVRNYLMNNCWEFPGIDFYTNAPAPDPIIEGDGTMISAPGKVTTQGAGIYTPVLDMNGSAAISFKYAFNENIVLPHRINIYLMNAENQILQLLESKDVTGSLAYTIYNYNSTLPAVSGPRRIFINFDGTGSTLRIGMDELSIQANRHYATGCNSMPQATADNVFGTPVKTAAGNVITNDSDANGEQISAYLTENSADGNVTLAANGSFTFTPNAGFTGTSTSFKYRICDNGISPLCSEAATVNIQFPAEGILPVSLHEFSANYNDNAVALSWTTDFENNNAYFNVERSTDGTNYVTAGTVQGKGTSTVSSAYGFTDNVKNISVSQHDLYYRLKQVDLDGTATYSKVLVVRLYKTKSLQMVSVTPNPAVNDIKVNVQLNESAFIVMKVVNNVGHEIKRQSLKGISGENKITLTGTSALPKGIYFLEVIINSKERMMVKLMKD